MLGGLKVPSLSRDGGIKCARIFESAQPVERRGDIACLEQSEGVYARSGVQIVVCLQLFL